MAGRWRARGLVALIAAAVSLAPAPEARAMDRDVRAVLVTGVYGIGVGTALVLASYPITGEVRGIFMGSSIGLYLGLALGVYFVTTKDDPLNPYRGRADSIGQGEPLALGGRSPYSDASEAPAFRFDYPVARF